MLSGGKKVLFSESWHIGFDFQLSLKRVPLNQLDLVNILYLSFCQVFELSDWNIMDPGVQLIQTVDATLGSTVG